MNRLFNRFFWTRGVMAVLSFFFIPVLSHAAVLQEAVQGKPDSYQTKYFLSDPIPQSAQLEGVRDGSIAKSGQDFIQQERTSTSLLSASFEGLHIKASYQRASLESTYRILSRYRSIPGGVTLEGMGSGLPRIETIIFDADRGDFVINGQMVFKNILGIHETRALVKSLERDNLLGVSLGDQDIVYGALPPGSLGAIYMKMADHYLGSIAFAQDSWTQSVEFPNGFRPQKYRGPGGPYAVYFNFSQFRFERSENSILPVGAEMTVTLIPLTFEKDGMSGYLPDFEKISRQEFPEAYERNIQHVIREIAYYEKDARINRVYGYGVMASFFRYLKNEGVDLERLVSSPSDAK